MSLCWKGVQRITQKAGNEIGCLGHDGRMARGKTELSFSYPALARNKMQRGCHTAVVHPSPIILEGEKPAHGSVVLRALKPTDAQKMGAVKISVAWPTFSKQKETEQQATVLSLQYR